MWPQIKINSYETKRILKIILLVFAGAIGFLSLWYTNNLVKELEGEERSKAKLWADATKLLLSPDYEGDVDILLEIVRANNTIPVILMDKDGNITGSRNLDSALMEKPEYLESMVRQMAQSNAPMEIEYVEGSNIKVYYENSLLLTKLKYYPFFQLSIIALFLAVSYFAFSYSRRSEQNQVWVGMSKETAHQLGTPISSLVAWLDYIKASDSNLPLMVIEEMDRDIERLLLITERFSKVGSEPMLEKHDLIECIEQTVNYLKARAPSKVVFEFKIPTVPVYAQLNVPLFAWVIENVTKNAIDAMDGNGKIIYEVKMGNKEIIFDIIDNGKGVPNSKIETIFKPGYTTKKRGWGLGLSLVKRIVQNYHQGHIFVKESIPNEKTVFRVVLKALEVQT
jgi:signal transduction histidine kinase